MKTFDLYGSALPARQSDDGAMKVAVFIVSAIALPSFLLFSFFLKSFHASRCGINSFLIDGWHPGVPTISLISFVGAAGSSGVFAMMSASSGGHDDSVKRWRDRSLVVALVTAPLAAWAIPALIFDQYCLSDSGADIRSAPWAPMHHYGWETADAVSVYCQAGKGGWVQRASVDFDRGKTLSMPPMKDNAGWFSVYSRVTYHLHGHPIAFDASAVSPSCPQHERDILEAR